MDAVALEAAVLFASSSAGFTVQRFAVDHPDRTLAIVLSGAPWSLRDTPGAYGLLQTVSNLLDPVDPDFVRQFVSSTVFRPVPAAFLEEMVGQSYKLPVHVWKAALEGLLEAVPAAETATIRAPTLVLWGERDEILPRSDGQALAAAIPDSRLMTYADTGHVVHWEDPERVAADDGLAQCANRSTARWLGPGSRSSSRGTEQLFARTLQITRGALGGTATCPKLTAPASRVCAPYTSRHGEHEL